MGALAVATALFLSFSSVFPSHAEQDRSPTRDCGSGTIADAPPELAPRDAAQYVEHLQRAEEL